VRSPVTPPVRLCIPHRYLLKQFVDSHENQQGGHAIECDPDAIIFNPIASTILKWRTFKLLRWMQNLHQSALGYKGITLISVVIIHVKQYVT
jgi:hypothetical protein